LWLNFHCSHGDIILEDRFAIWLFYDYCCSIQLATS